MRPEILNALPFPVAQLYLRSMNAKSWAEKHHNAYYLLEAGAKWLASVAVVEYLREEGSRTKKADEALKALALPSTGQWVQILRTLAEHFSKRVDAASHPLGAWSLSLVGRSDLPKSTACLKKISDMDGLSPGVGAMISPMALFNALPAYRNKHLGHGALAKEAFYAEMAPVLLDAATELLSELDLLAKGDCLLVEEKRETGDGSVIERIRFVGPVPMRMEPLVLNPGEAYACQPGRLCLDWGSGIEPLVLFPLLHATWQEEQAEVFFLNRSLRGDTPEYLSYASGKVIKGEGFEGEFRAFLGRIVKKAVDSREEKKLRELSLSESGAGAEPLPEGVQRLGHFRLYGELGKGGMGVVYLAEQESLHRLVALKTLPFEKGRDPVRQGRFLREIQSLSKTESSNVVKILDSGEEQGVLWYGMELVDGVELSVLVEELRKAREEKKKLKGSDLWAAIHIALQSERNRRRTLLGMEPLSETEPPSVPEHLKPYQNKHVGMSLAVLMQDAARALQNIHEQEKPVIHRDIKPTNLMVTAEGRLVLMDFGLARMEGGTTLTVADTVLGTICYAPPEQIRRMTKVDTRADIYSLGATFHELATLGPLYEAHSEVELISKITDETSKPAEIHALDHDFPEDFSIILQKCVLKDPSQRYGSAKELTEDLQRYLSGSPILARKPSFRYYAKMTARKYSVALAVGGIASFLLLVLLVGSSVWNLRERRRAEEQERRATARYLLSQSLLNADNDKSPVYLAAALRTDPRESSSDTARACFDAAQEQLFFPHRVLGGHSQVVSKVAFSPDGSYLASASNDRTPRLWDLKTGEVRILEGHLDSVDTVTCSPDGSMLASASDDHIVRLWDVKTGQSRVLKGHEDWVDAVAFSPNGGLLASASLDKTVRLWDVQTGETRILKGHEGAVRAVAFSPDASLLASASDDRTVRLWNVQTGEVRVLRGHEKGIWAIAFSPDGTLLASASWDKTVRLWDVRTGEARIFNGHEALVWAVAFSPDGSLLASASGDGTVRLWDVRTGEARIFKGHEGCIRAVAFSPDGAFLASASDDKTVRIWDVKTGEARILKGHDNWVWDIAFSPYGSLLASASWDKTIRLWDVKTGQTPVLKGHEAFVACLSFFPDGSRLTSASYDRNVRTWYMKTGQSRVLARFEGAVSPFTFSRDGSCLVSISNGRALHLWDVRTGKALVLKDHEADISEVAVSPDGAILASGDVQGIVRLWDVKTGESRVLKGHENAVVSVSFSPDAAFLASASNDKTVRLWDVKTGESRVLKGHEGTNTAVAFSPDGSLLASGSSDKTVRLWDVRTGKAHVLRGHEERISAVAFSPDGSLLASSSFDKTVRLWDVQTGEARVLQGHEGVVHSAAFSPDGSLLASRDDQGIVRLWDVKTGAGRILNRREEAIWSVTFSPGGSLIVGAAVDGTIRLWSPLPKSYFPNQTKPVWILGALPAAEILHALDSVTNLRYDPKTDAVKPLPFTGVPKEWIEEETP